ncbi:MAG: RNA polymerase subunit sigma-24 [Cytophaga sp.]|nr:RNA polymerase subunit sigma-24 [Cytophaga sp.]
MEEQSFLEKLDQHKGIITRVIHLYADDAEDRKDLRQEIIYQSWKSYGAFRGDAKFSTWLYKISLNVSLTFISKKRKKPGWSESGQELFSTHPPELSERADRLYRAIRKLNDIDRGIIILHLDGYDNEEISEMTGISKNNTGVKLHRIKQQLTELLNQRKDGLAK